ncbi:polysaccharide pyruvyl transferase CsaB [Halobacillus dabanensis]|uniref:Polysaccharide pyruvyl transferase CsaB n=1 Tax=Halobacillus dabanensis TaxID=240302 RepID=A0A1I3XE60_HALDA|nr:polysaccharide pyruvyl transferase CsaB [Halobacillus dabanensis]SFK17795.1 polysaccharide pyruvyl transferase CsaB [Halobacillus dabanensis]
MKIVLSGYYGFYNTGDETILQSIIRQLKSIEPDTQLIVLSQDPVYTEKTYGVEAVNRWNIREIIKALKSSDGLISGGGSLLQDATGPRSIIYYTGIMHMAKWLKKPVYVYAQGMGPFHKRTSRQLVKLALNRVDGLSVRDFPSKRLLEEVGVSKDIDVFPDPVFAHPTSLPTTDTKKMNRKIAVSIREWKNADSYIRKVASALDHFAEQGEEIVFVPMHGKADEACSEQVTSHMKGQATIHSGDASIEEKLSVIASADVLIGMRLHALIFACICHVPFAALSYDPKIKALSDELDYPVTADVEGESWTEQAIIDSVHTIFTRLDEHKVQLREKVEVLQADARLAAEKALDCFRNKK